MVLIRAAVYTRRGVGLPFRQTRRSGGWVALTAASTIALALVAPASAVRVDATADRSLTGGVVSAINAARTASDVKELNVSRALARAARKHALSMAALGYFSHSSANGSSYERRIAAYYGNEGRNWAVGEILAWATGNVTPQRVLAMWLSSAPHHRQLLSSQWRDIGVSAVRVADAPGVYGGRTVTIVVVDFGRRG